MKKVLLFIFFINLFFYTTAFAESTGMPTSFKVTYKSINVNQIEISWDPIPHVREYRICIANNCGGPDETKVWITIYPNQTSYIHDLPVGKTERFFVHALMEQSATKWTFTDDRPNSFGLKWDNGPGYFNYTNDWVDPNSITTTTTVLTKQEDDSGLGLVGQTTVLSVPKIPGLSTTATTIKLLEAPKTVRECVYPINCNSFKDYHVPFPVINIDSKENKVFGMNDYEFVFLFVFTVLAIAVIYYARTSDSRYEREQRELKQDREYEMQLKDKEIEIEKLRFEQNRVTREDNLREKQIILDHERSEYELKELSKTKIQNEHEQNMKKIDHDVLAERLSYSERQLKDERQYSLDQQKIAAQNAEQVLNYVMPIMQGRDAHELKMAEIKASSPNTILDVDDVTEAKVKFKK